MSENTPFPITLDELIRFVHLRDPEGDDLGRLQTAVVVSDGLDEQADHLIGHFVDQARGAGASWTAIGQSMGVSKQAAQQRFVVGDELLAASQGKLFTRFTPRARKSIAAAEKEARRQKHTQVGTEHIVLGLLAETGGIAAQALADQGITAAAVRARVKAEGLTTTESPPKRVPFSGAAKKVLQLALREALRLGHNYIGTEHVLLGVVAESDGLGGRILRDLGVDESRLADYIGSALAAAAQSAAKKPRRGG